MIVVSEERYRYPTPTLGSVPDPLKFHSYRNVPLLLCLCGGNALARGFKEPSRGQHPAGSPERFFGLLRLSPKRAIIESQRYLERRISQRINVVRVSRRSGKRNVGMKIFGKGPARYNYLISCCAKGIENILAAC